MNGKGRKKKLELIFPTVALRVDGLNFHSNQFLSIRHALKNNNKKNQKENKAAQANNTSSGKSSTSSTTSSFSNDEFGQP